MVEADSSFRQQSGRVGTVVPLRVTALLLLVVWFLAILVRQTVVPFPPWAFEAASTALLLQFAFYALGALLEVSSRCVSAAPGLSRVLHHTALTVFLLGGLALYGLAGDVIGLASMWALYLLSRILHRHRQETDRS